MQMTQSRRGRRISYSQTSEMAGSHKWRNMSGCCKGKAKGREKVGGFRGFRSVSTR